MPRKRLTQIFPFLIPLRTWERVRYYNLKMALDKNKYAKDKKELYSNVMYELSYDMINEGSGYDIEYQYNKADNMRISTKSIDGLVIHPGETFSVWKSLGYINKRNGYKKGLCIIDGKIEAVYGGGLCLLSDVLYYAFLHSPLEIIERHSHKVDSFPVPTDSIPFGVDSTISEGWLDLKVKNNEDFDIQINIYCTEDNRVITKLLTEKEYKYNYKITTEEERFVRKNGHIYHENKVYKNIYENDKLINKELILDNSYLVKYEPDESIKIEGD